MFDNEDDFDPMERRNHLQKMPLYIKARELSELVRHLAQSVENTDIEFKRKGEKEMLEHTLSFLRKNSMIIPAKIAGAVGVDLYDIKMENAAIIRSAARELITDARGIQMHGFKDTEYLDLLRKEVDEFRILFAEWVKTFDPWNYSIDRWGLFNPPGINYDDHDPDDDVPFDMGELSDEFFGDTEDDDDNDDEEDFEEDDNDDSKE
ncbi:hypothetical protein [Aequorivita marina]|uniref:hypothetical protein n=1 Tax=Aequorivita marina TaxID=3073654 RepID=UPI0028763914|nr:hypothetical protein [Aequorivita sp. S2608]MDS1299299.1 hypothetical protein [Aequorivita sp. S2608]